MIVEPAPILLNVLNASVQGGAGLALAWGLCRFLPRLTPEVRCWIWRLAYLKLLIALACPFALPLPLLSGPAAQVELKPDASAEALTALDRVQSAAGRPAGEPGANLTYLQRGLLVLWLAGAGVCAMQLLRAAQAARRLRRRCLPVEEAKWLDDCAALCRRMSLKRPPQLLRATGIGSPLLLDGRQAAIVFPSELLDTCAHQELKLMLAHELAHLKRQDLRWCWLPTLAHILFYFHPLVWPANREWRVAQEIACDDLALEITGAPPADYGSTLLKVAARSRPDFQPGLAAVSADELPQTLKRRLIAMKTRQNLQGHPRPATAAALLVLPLALALLPWKVVAQTSKASAAQETSADEKKRGEVSLDQALQLTLEQQVHLNIALLQFRQRAEAIKSDPAATPDARKIASESLNREFEAHLHTLLSPTQWMTLQKLGGLKAVFAARSFQKGFNPEDVKAEIAEHIRAMRQLNLTDAQQQILKQTLEEGLDALKGIFDDGSLTDEERVVKVKALHRQIMEALRALLTPEQQKKLQEIGHFAVADKAAVDSKEVVDKIAYGIAHAAEVFQKLGLSADQQSRAQQIVTQGEHRLQALSADRSLTDERRMQQVKQVHETIIQQLSALLTPAQRQRLDNLVHKEMGASDPHASKKS
jgi:beta-lactamase regulating signal transducer with metallopeptidase domain